MYKFGKNPPRALQSFGVAGLLEAKAHVFYSTLFSTKHLGRVSDLLSARLKEAKVDELRLRAMMLYGVYEAYQAQFKNAPLGGAFSEPLVLECGIDDEKFAIGVSFTLAESVQLSLDGIEGRIQSGATQNPFETLLSYLLKHAHRVVVRAQASIRRYEVVALVGIEGKIDAEDWNSGHSIEIVSIDKNPQASPDVKAYVELGDLDYPTLLSEDAPGNFMKPSPTGELLVKATERAVTGIAEPIQVPGQAEGSDATKVSGKTETLGDEAITVKGKVAGPDDTAIVVESAKDAEIEHQKKLRRDLEGVYEEKIEELRKKIEALEMNRKNDAQEQSDSEAEEREKPKSGPSLLKRVWNSLWSSDDDEESSSEPEKPEAKAESDTGTETDAETGTDSESEPESGVASHDSVLRPEDVNENSDLGKVADQLAKEIKGGKLEETLDQAKEDAKGAKAEIAGQKASRWVEGLVGDLVAEKGRLYEVAKKLNLSVKQKEVAFHNKEIAMQEEIKRRDEMIRQKTFALNRAKEQLAEANRALDRTKAETRATTAEDTSSRHKLVHAQKLLALAKDENAALQAKIDEMRNQVNSAQAESKSQNDSQAIVNQLYGRLERSMKQAEEFKKANKELMDRIAEIKREKGTNQSSSEDLKRRLEAAVKITAQTKKEMEGLKKKSEELEIKEMRASVELERARAEIRALKAAVEKKSA